MNFTKALLLGAITAVQLSSAIQLKLNGDGQLSPVTTPEEVDTMIENYESLNGETADYAYPSVIEETMIENDEQTDGETTDHPDHPEQLGLAETGAEYCLFGACQPDLIDIKEHYQKHAESIWNQYTDTVTTLQQPTESTWKSTDWADTVEIAFINDTTQKVEVWWHDYDGANRSYGYIDAGKVKLQSTYATHPWSSTGIDTPSADVTVDGSNVWVPVKGDDKRYIYIKDNIPNTVNPQSKAPITSGDGTVFENKQGDWIRDDSIPSLLYSIGDPYGCTRQMWDKRVDPAKNTLVQTDAWCFDTVYSDSQVIEIRVNKLLGTVGECEGQAHKYADAIGRVPFITRSKVKTLSINGGDANFGTNGITGDIEIYSGYGDKEETDGYLDEILFHEASHLLDKTIYADNEWSRAVELDGAYISKYAKQNKGKNEDVTETYLVWMATRYASHTFTKKQLAQWEADMGYRFYYFDKMSCKPGMMQPYKDCVPGRNILLSTAITM